MRKARKNRIVNRASKWLQTSSFVIVLEYGCNLDTVCGVWSQKSPYGSVWGISPRLVWSTSQSDLCQPRSIRACIDAVASHSPIFSFGALQSLWGQLHNLKLADWGVMAGSSPRPSTMVHDRVWSQKPVNRLLLTNSIAWWPRKVQILHEWWDRRHSIFLGIPSRNPFARGREPRNQLRAALQEL
jgi:hypothetical protein